MGCVGTGGGVIINMCLRLLAAAVLSIVSAQQQEEVKSIPLDRSLELHPYDKSSVTETITGILWKHGPNKVAEWDKNFGPDVDYYRTYKERTELDKETVKLVINNMTIEDSGVYSVEVNGRPLKTYRVEVIKYLPWGAAHELLPDARSVTENITGILWKHGPNKVAEWDDGFGPDVDYYGTYKERTELNKKTGRLVIKNMLKEDSGVYSVDVNGRLQSKTYRVEVIKKVPKPSVEVKPLACSPHSDNCTLVCQGDVKDSGPIDYHWKEDEGEWMVSDSGENPERWDITNDDQGKKVERFFCEMMNLVSVEQSDPRDNPFTHKGHTPVGGIVVSILILIVCLVFGVCWVLRSRIMTMIAWFGTGSKAEGDVEAARSEHTPKPRNGHEGIPLTTGEPTSEEKED